MSARSLDSFGETFVPKLDAERLERVDDRVLAVLQDRKWHDRLELTIAAKGAVIHSSVARLRKRLADEGLGIVCERDTTAPKSGRTWYQLVTLHGSVPL